LFPEKFKKITFFQLNQYCLLMNEKIQNIEQQTEKPYSGIGVKISEIFK